MNVDNVNDHVRWLPEEKRREISERDGCVHYRNCQVSWLPNNYPCANHISISNTFLLKRKITDHSTGLPLPSIIQIVDLYESAVDKTKMLRAKIWLRPEELPGGRKIEHKLNEVFDSNYVENHPITNALFSKCSIKQVGPYITVSPDSIRPTDIDAQGNLGVNNMQFFYRSQRNASFNTKNSNDVEHKLVCQNSDNKSVQLQVFMESDVEMKELANKTNVSNANHANQATKWQGAKFLNILIRVRFGNLGTCFVIEEDVRDNAPLEYKSFMENHYMFPSVKVSQTHDDDDRSTCHWKNCRLLDFAPEIKFTNAEDGCGQSHTEVKHHSPELYKQFVSVLEQRKIESSLSKPQNLQSTGFMTRGFRTLPYLDNNNVSHNAARKRKLATKINSNNNNYRHPEQKSRARACEGSDPGSMHAIADYFNGDYFGSNDNKLYFAMLKVQSEHHSQNESLRISKPCTDAIIALLKEIVHALGLTSDMAEENFYDAVSKLLTNPLLYHTLDPIRKVVAEYKTLSRDRSIRLQNARINSGLQFPIPSLNSELDEFVRIGVTTLLEYITSDLIEHSGNLAAKQNRKLTTIADLKTAIECDVCLLSLLKSLNLQINMFSLGDCMLEKELKHIPDISKPQLSPSYASVYTAVPFLLEPTECVLMALKALRQMNKARSTFKVVSMITYLFWIISQGNVNVTNLNLEMSNNKIQEMTQGLRVCQKNGWVQEITSTSNIGYWELTELGIQETNKVISRLDKRTVTIFNKVVQVENKAVQDDSFDINAEKNFCSCSVCSMPYLRSSSKSCQYCFEFEQ